MEKNFYIGLDIGTDSIGWAVTDLEYRLAKMRGKDFWGSYLFETANTAQERRAFRSARRRIARTAQRLKLLKSLFAEEIAKVDPTFFIRLRDSGLHLVDKDGKLTGKYSLFSDERFTDKNFHERFPTVHHLRNFLLNNPPEDIRFLYLAVHHIVKNRGHFLFEGQSFDVRESGNTIAIFQEINGMLAEGDEPLATFSLDKIDEALLVLKDKKLTKTDKAKKLQALLAAGKEKHLSAAIKAMAGGKVKLSALYPDYDGEEISVEFESEQFNEVDLPAIEDAIGMDEAGFIRKCKAIYDWATLSAILGDEQYLSAAKIKTYEKHKSDLLKLKAHVLAQDSSKALYRKVFKRIEKENNYAAYIGKNNGKRFAKCTKKDFYDFLKKNVSPTDEMLAEMENGDFLPKQVSNENGIIPYQLHRTELMAILENCAQYFPFLKEKNEGISAIEKIDKLLTFRIPYYVGPLYTQQGHKFAWSVRNPSYENVSITPWNFDAAIDKDASETQFIRRMTNECPYLVGEDVLPAASFLYSEFIFLNELNNLKVCGAHNSEAKALIYEYAKTRKKVTLKGCLDLLKGKGLVEKDAKKEDVFSGLLDGEFHTSLSSYDSFRKILGDRADTQSEMCEEIIEWITATSDRERLALRIKKKYGNVLSEQEIKQIKSLNFVKWGTVSRKFLTETFSAQCHDENGEPLSIIQAMRAENKNFMQVYHNYAFQDAVEAYKRENLPTDKVTYQTVSELYCSPSVKRAIWRTIELTREIVSVMGGAPKKIFVEMARDTEDNGKKGKRTVSRKQKVLDLYASIKGEARNWREEIDKLEDTKFNSKKLFLYYMQMGKCLYSGKDIPVEHVFNTNIVDIEHIYPQSKIKDDSFDNIALVYKNENERKGDKYPITADIQQARLGLWRTLRDKGFLSEKKFERLTRKTPLTMDELTDFINRQLVETRQSTKLVCDLLKRVFPETEIVYAKAGNADDFKKANELIKVRELNDLHHAKDAFINIVVGNVYNTKFQHDASVFFRKHGVDSYHMKNLFKQEIENAWKPDMVEGVKQTFRKNSCRIVRFTAEGKGAWFNATIKQKKEGLIPLKEGGAKENTLLYGGYDSANTAYFTLVRSEGKKGEVLLSLEAISIYRDLHFAKGESKLDYLKSQGYRNPEIVLDKIKLNTLFQLDGSYAYIRGKTGRRIIWCNANELFLEEEQIKYLKEISNCFRDKKKYFMKELPRREEINTEDNIRLYDAFVSKLQSDLYAGLSVSGQSSVLQAKREKFISLNCSQQLQVLFEILKLMQCNSALSDLSLVDGVAHAGSILSSKDIQDKKVKIICQSPTGHYRRVIDCAQFL